MNAHDSLKSMIEHNVFKCEEDAIDEIERQYKKDELTKSQRAELLRLV